MTAPLQQLEDALDLESTSGCFRSSPTLPPLSRSALPAVPRRSRYAVSLCAKRAGLSLP